jgi:hypothetical protein
VSNETFFNYRQYRWLIVTALSLFVMTALYCYDRPMGGRNGGTTLGYTYGGIAAFGILYLMWYGVRKRSYRSSMTTLRGWLAAHVWFGIGLLVVVPLHSGFSFGLNVHTLAYGLMALTIVSGIWGALNYSTLANDVLSHRGGGSLKSLFDQLDVNASQINSLVSDSTDKVLSLRNAIDKPFKFGVIKSLFRSAPQPLERSKIATMVAELDGGEREVAMRLVSAITAKLDLQAKVHKEIGIQTKLKLWLFFHVPLAFSCVAALAIHILVVFFYW